MYFPYFRGKQFELIVIRDMAQMLSENSIHPIIEPVRENLTGLQRALTEVVEHKGKAIVVVNPQYGDLQGEGTAITEFLNEHFSADSGIAAGVLLTSDMSVDDAVQTYNEHENLSPVFIHSGFTHPKELASYFGDDLALINNFFIEQTEQIIYRRHFNKCFRVLINDSFEQKRNADYGPVDRFSDLHLTYRDRGLDGYGDFLIVGDSYSESGGPAYAVAIHLTFINTEQDDVMYIYHFVSDDRSTPTDPAGKFAQALDKLINLLVSGNSMLEETAAIKEFRSLHSRGHFPGLGVVKKLSMMHHLETLAMYHKANGNG